jgi:predicted N-formylglutamate amidohydrolase
MLGTVVEVEGSARTAANLSLCAHDPRRLPDHLEKPGFVPEHLQSLIVRTSAQGGDNGLNARYGSEGAASFTLDRQDAANGLASVMIEIHNDLISEEATFATRADEVCRWVPAALAFLNEGSSW